MDYIKLKLILLILLINLTGCNFNRFGQEKYICRENKLNINVIDILQTRAIKKSYVTILGKEYFSEIKSLNKAKTVLFIDNIVITIDKKSNEITAMYNENIYFLKCEVEKFKI